MALQYTKLQNVTQISSGINSIYTNPTGYKTFIKGFIIFNPNSGSANADIYMVPSISGSTGIASGGNQLFKLSMNQNETIIPEIPFSLVLTDSNDSIQAKTNSSNNINIILCGGIDI